MACEIVLDLVPAYCAFFYNWLIGVTLANYAGDVVSLLMSASAAACGVYYWRIFQVIKIVKI
jgi:hypothetical protein